jgi:hypothetical protein
VNGDLIVADCDNHQIRLVPTSPKGVAKQITLIPTRELIQEKAANSEGELVVLDSVFVGRGTTEITIHLNTQNCSLVPGGVNELHIVPMPGFSIVQEEIKENFIKFKLDNRFQSEEANLEVYLTLEDPALPGVYLAKRTYLNVPIGRDKTIPLQELVYDLHIWPY